MAKPIPATMKNRAGLVMALSTTALSKRPFAVEENVDRTVAIRTARMLAVTGC